MELRLRTGAQVMIQLLNAGAAAAASAAANKCATSGCQTAQWIVDFMQALTDNWQVLIMGAVVVWVAGALIRIGLFGERKK